MRITLATRSADWKDRLAGWHTWRVEFRCSRCRKEVACQISGTRNEAEQFFLSRVCDNCAEGIEPQRKTH